MTASFEFFLRRRRASSSLRRSSLEMTAVNCALRVPASSIASRSEASIGHRHWRLSAVRFESAPRLGEAIEVAISRATSTSPRRSGLKDGLAPAFAGGEPGCPFGFRGFGAEDESSMC